MLLVLLLMVAPLATAQNQYCSFTPNHTLCNKKGLGPRCGSPVPARGVSKQDAAVIVAQHNKLRSLVARGQETRGAPGPQPPAANIRLMEYDAELATVAQGHADQCIFDHECVDCRRVSRFRVGQNLFTSYQSFFDPTVQWERAIQAWFDEVEFVNPSIISPFRFSQDLGHYTQMMWWSTWKVGCGFTMYKEGGWWKKLYTCDYGPGGNIIFGDMYRVGNPCSSCPVDTTCSLQYPGLCEVTGDGDESTDTDVTTAPATATSSMIAPTGSTSAPPNATVDSNELDNNIPVIPSGDGDSSDSSGDSEGDSGSATPSGDSGSRTPSGDGENRTPSGGNESRTTGNGENTTPGDSGSSTPSGSRDPPRRPPNGSSNRIPLLTLSGDGSILPVFPGRGKGDQELDFNLLIEFFNSVRRRQRPRQESDNVLPSALSITRPKIIIRTNFSSDNLTTSNPSTSANPVPASNNSTEPILTRLSEPATRFTQPTPRVTEPTTRFTEPTTQVTEPTTRLSEPRTRFTEPTILPNETSITSISLSISETPNTTTPMPTTQTPLPDADNSSSTPEEPIRGQKFNNNNRFRAGRPQQQQQPLETGDPEHNFVSLSGGEPHLSDLAPFLHRNGLATKVITTNSLSSVHSILGSLHSEAKPIVLFRTGTGQLTELDPKTLAPVSRRRRSRSVSRTQAPGSSLLLACDLDARPCAFDQIGANWTLAFSDTEGQYAETQLSTGQQTKVFLKEKVPSPPSEALCVLLSNRRSSATAATSANPGQLPTVKIGARMPNRGVLQKATEAKEGVWGVSRVTLESVKGLFELFFQVEATNAPSRVAFNELVVMDGSC